jgi:hypothetical protein
MRPTSETVVSQWRYLYRAIDRDGALVEVILSEHRDLGCSQGILSIGQNGGRCHAGTGHDRRA